MQVVDKDGNVYGQGLQITSIDGKPKTISTPGGTAGGDLSGTYPNPSVVKLLGNTIPTNANGYLKNDGSGVLTWATISTGITVNTTPITGGTSGRLLFDNAGTVGETSGINWNSSTATLSLLDSPFYSQAGNSSTNTAFSITGTASSNYTIYSSRQFIFNTGQSMYFNTDTDGGSALDRAWYFAGARSGLTGGRTYGALTVDSSGFPSFTLYNNDNGARILLASNATSYFNGGNLLVGTTTDAGFKFDVNGTARVTNLKIDPVGTINFSSPTVSSQQSSISSTDGNKLLLSSSFWNTVSAGQSIGLNATYVSLSGTSGTSPTVGLTFFRGSTPIAEQTTFHFGQSFSEAIGITGRARGATQFFINRNIDASTARLIDFQEFGTSRFIVNSTGNVLIGSTTDAGYKLDVAGTTRLYNAIIGKSSTGAQSLKVIASTGDSTPVFSVTNEGQTSTWFSINGTNGAVSISAGTTIGSINISSQIITIPIDTGSQGLANLTLKAGSQNYLNRAGGNLYLQGGAAAGTGDGVSGFISFSTTDSTASAYVTNSLIERARITIGGNLLIGTTVSNGYKLEVNGTGYFGSNLRVNGTITASTPTANTYICHIGLTVDQVLVSGADALLDFVDVADTNNWYDPTTKKFLPTVAGYYHVDFSLWFEPSPVSTGQYNIQVRKNGTTVMISQQPTINNGTGQSLMSSKLVYFNGTTDYIDFTAYQSTGSNRNIWKGTDSSGTYATIYLLAI